MKFLTTILIFLLVLMPAVTHADNPSKGKITKIPWAGTLLSEVDPNVKYEVKFPGVLLDKVAWAEIQARLKTHEEVVKKQLELKLKIFSGEMYRYT